MRFFPVLILAICFSACGADVDPESTTAPIESTVPESKDLRTGLLDGFPEDLIESGCDCSLHLENGNEEDLFFVFDWKGNGGGQLRINDKDVVLQRGASLKTGNEKYDSYLHQSDKWTVKTSITERGIAGEEGTTYNGKVKISNRQTGVKKEVRVKGTCSC